MTSPIRKKVWAQLTMDQRNTARLKYKAPFGGYRYFIHRGVIIAREKM